MVTYRNRNYIESQFLFFSLCTLCPGQTHVRISLRMALACQRLVLVIEIEIMLLICPEPEFISMQASLILINYLQIELLVIHKDQFVIVNLTELCNS